MENNKKGKKSILYYIIIALFLLLSGGLGVNQLDDSQENTVIESQGSIENTDGKTENEEIVAAEYTFRNEGTLQSHYEKHGIEMGFENPEDYLAAANKVVANSESLHKLEQEDGDDVYYLEETNEFVVVSKDGYIRTYFLPSAGIDYYNRQ